ncbi:outer membrane beta-barrel protein [Carboxylicivirga mesophila]|uniref:Outer membrane beta-barrel protein n=1 Tax=Carboxylicivirga mesophila TaxID=1166478 RepID=A0ABS5KFJ4_9BACT|nr:outer membrane beta-barrel protein [Carboxylicivirga mesophila]MBS2213557.1 outer membrane beta-barrel protein [Carboxylicivirga mesophila]
MKKAMMILSLLMAGNLAFVVMAQDKKFGIRGGYQTSYLTQDGDKVGSSKSGFYLGAYKDTKVLPFLHVNTGLEYSQFGASKLDNGDYTLNYIGVPLALKVKVGPLYALGGSGFNVKVAEKGNPFDSSAKWFDIPAYVGAGFNILFVAVEAKHTWGLTDINNGLNNNGFQVGLSMRF